jgi:hypothetical protein
MCMLRRGHAQDARGTKRTCTRCACYEESMRRMRMLRVEAGGEKKTPPLGGGGSPLFLPTHPCVRGEKRAQVYGPIESMAMAGRSPFLMSMRSFQQVHGSPTTAIHDCRSTLVIFRGATVPGASGREPRRRVLLVATSTRSPTLPSHEIPPQVLICVDQIPGRGYNLVRKGRWR